MNSVQFQEDYRGFHALYFTEYKDRLFPVYLACARSTKWHALPDSLLEVECGWQFQSETLALWHQRSLVLLVRVAQISQNLSVIKELLHLSHRHACPVLVKGDSIRANQSA